MDHLGVSRRFLCVVSFLVVASVTADVFQSTLIGWNGVIALFPIPRASVQQRLDELFSEIPCHKGKLQLPATPIFPEHIRSDQHLIGINIGFVEATSFVNELSENVANKYTLRTPTVQFTIPHLVGSDPDAPFVNLVLDSFIATEKPFLNPNIAIRTTQVDELVLTDTSVRVQHGDEHFTASWSVSNCTPPTTAEEQDWYDHLYNVVIPYDCRLNFSACARSDVQGADLCRSLHKAKKVLMENNYNGCQEWGASTESYHICETNFQIESISKTFQDLGMLESDKNMEAMEAQIINNLYVYGWFKVPCA